MGHTNSTANYGLPQFISTDKPAWLTDINGAFSDIDTAIDTAKDTADGAAQDASDALTAATSAGSTASGADTKADGALASIADTFSATDTYSVGDEVIYNSLLYTCTVAVTTPGAWTGATNWTRSTVEGLINDLSTATTTALSMKANASSVYTISQVDTLLGNKLDESVHATTGSGTFAGLVGDSSVWLIIVQRISINATCAIIVNRSGATFSFREIIKDSGFSYNYNSSGTISITYNNSTAGVYGGAYKLSS